MNKRRITGLLIVTCMTLALMACENIPAPVLGSFETPQPANAAAQAIPDILAQRGLKPFISRFDLTEIQQGNVWLFVVLEVSPVNYPEDYAASEVCNDISRALYGLPVVISESYGLRYAVLLDSSDLLVRTNWL
jgi:hypothetical protein